MDDTRRHVERMIDQVLALDSLPVPDSDLPDLLGALNRLIKVAGDWRRMLQSEAEPGMVGQDYETIGSRSATRSYNAPGLLAAFGGPSALPGLIQQDAVRLTWRWTQLRQAAERAGVTLSITPREITDDDPEALIGEVWETRLRVQPVTKEVL